MRNRHITREARIVTRDLENMVAQAIYRTAIECMNIAERQQAKFENLPCTDREALGCRDVAILIAKKFGIPTEWEEAAVQDGILG